MNVSGMISGLLGSAVLILMSAGSLSEAVAQLAVTTAEHTYAVELGATATVTKTRVEDGGQVYRAEIACAPASQKVEMLFGTHKETVNVVNDRVIITYSLWNPVGKTKDCYIIVMDDRTKKAEPRRLVHSTKINSKFSYVEIPYATYYSPDKSKMAILRDNLSLGYDHEPEILILETGSFQELSRQTFPGKVDGVKRIVNLEKTSLDDAGNISTVLHMVNPETKMTSKSFTARIPFNGSGLEDLQPLEEVAMEDIGDDRSGAGRCYTSLQDLVDNKPIPGIRTKAGSMEIGVLNALKVIDDDGNIKRVKMKDLPGAVFTYTPGTASEPWVMRTVGNTVYIVLAVGEISHYVMYGDQSKRFWANGWNGELERFKEKDLEELLKKHGLFDDYLKEKPKREFKDTVNDYYNKEVFWQNKYIIKLNERM